MNNQYIKTDVKWDLNMYLSKINREFNGVGEAVTKFFNCSEKIKEETSKANLSLEFVKEVEIEKDLAEAFAKAMSNLQNEVFYNSLFIMSTSFFEFSLTELCRIIHPYLKKEIAPYFHYKAKAQGIDKAKEYLKEALDVKVAEFEGWSNIKDHFTIRNLFIHNSGNLMVDYDKPLEEQRDYPLAKSKGWIDISETGYVFITDIKEIQRFHSELGSFIDKVFAEVESRISAK